MSDDQREYEVSGRHVRDGSHYQPSPQIALLILVLFVVSVVGVLHYVSAVPVGGGSSNSSVTTTTLGPTNTTTTTIPRSRVKVQVANGTTTPGLARVYTDQLQIVGWDVLGPINSPQVAQTIVYFQPGFQWAAVQIAAEIKAPASSVHPLNGATPVAGAAGDNVIVMVGPDLART